MNSQPGFLNRKGGVLFGTATHDTRMLTGAWALATAGSIGEISCFAVHPEYRKGGQGERLLAFAERRAAEAGMKRVFVLTTRTGHWFQEHGYEPAAASDLPSDRQSLIDASRGSKVLLKTLA